MTEGAQGIKIMLQKSGKVFRTGAIIGSYEKLTPESDNKIHAVTEIHSDLLP